MTVANLSTKNHPANGIIGWGANGFSNVYGTSGEGHERYGVLAAASKNIKITGNAEKATLRAAPYLAGTAGVSLETLRTHRRTSPTTGSHRLQTSASSSVSPAAARPPETT